MIVSESALLCIDSSRVSQLFQRDECMRKIRELGSLPSDAFEKYQGLGVKQVGLLPCLPSCDVCLQNKPSMPSR